MKLSEMTTDQLTNTLCVAAPCIANITSDEKLVALLRDTISKDGELTRAAIMTYGANKLAEIVPIVLKDHRADVYGILAAVNGQTVDEIGQQSALTTLKQIKELTADPDLMDFFKSASPTDTTE